jgi:hypothetical protein
MIDKVIPLPRRPIDDAKMAHAFMELEPYLLSLERAAKIARHFFLEDPDEEELELGRFAVDQFQKLASDFRQLYFEKWEEARQPT